MTVEECDSLSNSEVLLKYKAAAEIANNALAEVLKAAQPGAKILELCQTGDAFIEKAAKAIFTKQREIPDDPEGRRESIPRGVAFPTCVSANNCVGHFSPESDDETTLKEGDMVKVDLGVHIDGYVAVVAHTIVAGQDPNTPIKGRQADALLAAHNAAEAALRLIKPGNDNNKVTEAINNAIVAFKCNPLENIQSHQTKQHLFSASKTILNKPNADHPQKRVEFETHDVFAVDIVVSTGDGKCRELETRTTIYKQNAEVTYQLKMKASRAVFSEVSKKFSAMPFTLRSLETPNARFGLSEAIKHGLMEGYPVTYTRPDDIVAQFKFSLLLTPNGCERITSGPELQKAESEYKIEDKDLIELLATPPPKRASKKKKKKAASSSKAEN